MGLESGTYVNDLNVSNPDGAVDAKSAGDNHLRLIKSVLKATFPGMGGVFSRTNIVTGGTLVPTVTDNTSVAVFRTATATMNLPAKASLHNGWYMWFFADGVDVTIDPNGSEKVNGAGSVTIEDGEFGIVFCTGVSGDEFIALMTSNPADLGTMTKTGDIIMSAAASRDGALLCDGTAYSRTTYAGLFAVIGTTWGVGDGATTFNVPDLRGRSPLGAGTGSGLTARTMGQTGGNENLAAHTHTVPGGSNATGAVDPYALTASVSVASSITSGSTGTGNAGNMHPFAVVNYFIITGLAA